MDLSTSLLRRILFFDGGLETMLTPHLTDEACVELLNLTRAKAVSMAHAHCALSGADVMELNTLRANRAVLSPLGHARDVRRINIAAAWVGRDAGMQYSVGSIGPAGELCPTDAQTRQELFTLYAVQCAALNVGGVDALHIQAMEDLSTARMALLAAKEHSARPIMLSFVLGKDGKTSAGDTIPAIVNLAVALGAATVGVQGGAPQALLPHVRRMAEISPIPVLARPDAIEPGGETIPPKEMAAAIQTLLEAGAGAVGIIRGCTPDHVRQGKAVVAAARVPQRPQAVPMISSATITAALADLQHAPVVRLGIDSLPANTPAVWLDLTQLSVQDAVSAVDQTQKKTPAALGFFVTAQQTEPVLFAYAGVAAVRCEDETALRKAIFKYGGHVLPAL